MDSIIAQLRKFRAPGMQPQNSSKQTESRKSRESRECTAGYVAVWTLRCLFLTSMHEHGIARLKFTASTPISELVGCFPDQSDWVLKMAGATGTTTVSGLLSAVGYTAPVELFTCYCCFMGDPDFDWVTADWLADNVKKLKVAIRDYRIEHGQNPNPAVIVKVVAGFSST